MTTRPGDASDNQRPRPDGVPTTAAMIAIGSELLCGQITNRNAAWLSAKFFDLGITTRHHATVDDVQADILRALDTAAAEASLIITTGGLGPTSDDLTRSVVAKWCGMPLEYHPASWDHITEIFSRYGSQVPETNRQQCYFPAGAQVLKNSGGTANAFAIHARGKELWILPGPPREVEAIWQDHVERALISRVPAADRPVMRMWRTIGRGESHVAEIIEPLVTATNRADGLEIAYRAHPPIIETKLRYRAGSAGRFTQLMASIDAALAPWLYERDGEDHLRRLVEQLARRTAPLEIVDAFTHGQIAEAVQPELRERRAFRAIFRSGPTSCSACAGDFLAVEPLGEDADNWRISSRLGGRLQQLERQAAYRGEPLRARNERSVAALAIKIWADWLAEI